MTQSKEERKIYQTQYDKDHSDNKCTYNKTYREKTESKAIRKKLESVMIMCVCGVSIRKYGLTQHLLTKKHINVMKERTECIECINTD